MGSFGGMGGGVGTEIVTRIETATSKIVESKNLMIVKCLCLVVMFRRELFGGRRTPKNSHTFIKYRLGCPVQSILSISAQGC